MVYFYEENSYSTKISMIAWLKYHFSIFYHSLAIGWYCFSRTLFKFVHNVQYDTLLVYKT